MERRAFLRLAGTASLLGAAGCADNSEAPPPVRAPSFEFAGVIVESLPTAEQYQPLDVTVQIEQDGTTKYERTHTVDDITHDTAFVVREEWMHERAPYSVTVSSPVHEAVSYTTAKLDEEDRDKFSNRSVYFGFQLTASTILFHPVPEK